MFFDQTNANGTIVDKQHRNAVIMISLEIMKIGMERILQIVHISR